MGLLRDIRDGAWGGELECSMMARLTGCTVKIINENSLGDDGKASMTKYRPRSEEEDAVQVITKKVKRLTAII